MLLESRMRHAESDRLRSQTALQHHFLDLGRADLVAGCLDHVFRARDEIQEAPASRRTRSPDQTARSQEGIAGGRRGNDRNRAALRSGWFQ